MAGHSKWANIRRHKAKQDAKRGQRYTKLIREITVAARCGADPNGNPRLRTALDKALEANMTKDVIERAIKRGAGGFAEDDVEEIRYEGYGPGGVAALVDCMTNNRNRTVADVRHAFTKHDGSLGTNGSVAYLFKKRGQMTFAPGLDVERIMDIALETGAIDVIINDDQSVDVITEPEDLMQVKNALAEARFVSEEADITMLAEANITVIDPGLADKIQSLLDTLEDLDDVQSVYTNADIQVEGK